MDNFELIDSKIEKFLKGQMTAQEEIEFKDTLNSDPEIKSRAQAMALMISQMKERKHDIDVVEGIKQMSLSEFKQKTGVKSTGSAVVIPLWKRPVMRYAASILLLLSFGIGGNQYYAFQQTVSLGNIANKTFIFDANGRGMKSATDEKVLGELNYLFNNVAEGKDLSTTIEQLTTVYSKSQNGDLEYKDYDVDISFQLAIAYIKNGNRKDAKRILEKICKDYPGKPNAKEANNLIVELNKIHAF